MSISTNLDLPEDYQDLLREFLDGAVEFVLIGGWAVAAHGHGRATDDMDILVRPSPDNAAKVYAALLRYGAPIAAHGIHPSLFEKPQYGYRMGRKPLLIEILTTVDGINFDEALQGSLKVTVGELQVPVIGKSALIKNKRAAGRAKDLADLEMLEEPNEG